MIKDLILEEEKDGGFFQMTENARGEKVRKNKFMYELVTTPEIQEFIDERCLCVNIKGDFLSFVKLLIDSKATFYEFIEDFAIPRFENSTKFSFDFPSNNDTRLISYKKDGQGDKRFREKYSKVFLEFIELSGLPIPERVRTRCAELAQAEWEAFSIAQNSDSDNYKLVIDKDFERIYSDDDLVGGGSSSGSCMSNKGQYSFYEDAVNASAVSLRDKCDEICCRAILWNEVIDYDTDEKFRLLERMYSYEGKEKYKRIMLNKLIEGKFIDGYKELDASYSEQRRFILNDGTSLYDRCLTIDCHLKEGDTISYQDSFAYYDYEEQKAYNEDFFDYDFNLATCEQKFLIEGRVYCVDDESYHYEEDCYFAQDTEEWYYNESNLYHTEDTDRYFWDSNELYYTADTGNYFEKPYNVYYTEDTDCYYENCDYLYVDYETGDYYEYPDSLIYLEDIDQYTSGEYVELGRTLGGGKYSERDYVSMEYAEKHLVETINGEWIYKDEAVEVYDRELGTIDTYYKEDVEDSLMMNEMGMYELVEMN